MTMLISAGGKHIGLYIYDWRFHGQFSNRTRQIERQIEWVNHTSELSYSPSVAECFNTTKLFYSLTEGLFWETVLYHSQVCLIQQ